MFPEAIERDYVDALRGIVRHIESTVLKKLPQIEPHFNAAVRQDGFADWFEEWMGELLQAVLLFVDDEKLASMVQVYTKQTADFNRKQFHKVLRSVYQVDIFTTEPWLEEALRMAEWENIQLIKSIPTQTLEKLRTRFMQAVRQGERWEDVVEDVKNVLNSSDKRAILIARDQVGKLNAHLTRLRQQHLGVKSYIWRGMLDERERAHHVEREGKQFDWDNPPDDGHPGEAILCRCYAEAVFPEFGELVEGGQSQSGLIVPPKGDIDQDLPISETTIDLIEQLKSANVEYRPVQLLKSKLSSEEIIRKLAGGDETVGSCASLALSYIGNKLGLDVTDYRGGKSREFFSKNIYYFVRDSKIKKKAFAVAFESREVADILQEEVKPEKEYLLITGKHAAIVRRNVNGLEYLEMQSPYENGWMSFNEGRKTIRGTLCSRFGCASKVKIQNGRKVFKAGLLVDIDEFKHIRSDIKAVSGYFNTAPDKQVKGSLGYEK